MAFGKSTGKPQNQRVEYILCGVAQSLKCNSSMEVQKHALQAAATKKRKKIK